MVLAINESYTQLKTLLVSLFHRKLTEDSEAAKLRADLGDLDAALVSYKADLAIAQALAQQDASNTLWQRDLSISHEKIGDIQRAQGDLDAALISYQASLEIRQALAQQDVNNTEWQRDLSISHNNIGDIQQAQGDLDAALISYQASLDMRQALAQHDPSNARWQVNLASSYAKIAQLDGQDARQYWQRAHDILQPFLTSTPNRHFLDLA